MNLPTPSRRGELWGAFLALIAAALLLYARTFGYDWTYDDFMVIVDNPDTQSLTGFFRDNYPGRPLRELTFLLDHALFGLDPTWWHLQSIFWHALAAFLLLVLVGRLGGTRWLAWTATLGFLVHPLGVEVVASISHRKDSLALVFCLAALLCYQKMVGGSRPWLWGIAALTCWVIGLYAKQTAVALVIVILAYEWQFVVPRHRFLLRFPKLVGVLAAVGGCGLLVWLLAFGGLDHYREWAEILLVKLEYYQDAELSTFFRTLLAAWAFMGMRIVFPNELAVEYLVPVPASWMDPWVVAGTALVMGCLVGFWLLRRSPLAMFGLVWAVAFAGPTSNIWPVAYWAADRYLYAPLAGLAILFAWGLAQLPLKSHVRTAAAALVIGSLAWVAWLQVPVWQSDETVYLQALEVSPQSSFVLNELGKIYERHDQPLLALDYYRRATRENPHNAAAHYNLGQALERSGALPRALHHYGLFLQSTSDAYREAAEALRKRLRRQYGLKFEDEPTP